MVLQNIKVIPIRFGGSDIFTHLLVVGPTRCGKSATVLKPLIYQLLLQKKMGKELGLSVIEPKGDIARMVAEVSKELELDYILIDPDDPNTAKFNPMEGNMNDVAEATVVVLKSMFGKQDAFFSILQEGAARNVTKLLKELHGDNIDILDVMVTLRDTSTLEAKVAELKKRDGMTDLVHYFEAEFLGNMRDKYRQHAIGLRAQLENMLSNDLLKHIMTGKSSLNIDKHFSEGGILAVSTGLATLGASGDAFGQFLAMHLQNGTYRRKGTEKSRIPHYLIIDEYSRYINPGVEIFLSLAAEYKVAGIFATQSIAQLEVESGKMGAKAIKRSILSNCRNKIAFGGMGAEDAKEFADIFGKDKIIMRQSTYKNRIFLPNLFPDSYRDTEEEEYRFDPTDLQDGLPKFHFVHQLLEDGTPQKPAIGKGLFMPRDWKEKREWESTATKTKQKLQLNGLFEKMKKKKVPKKQIVEESNLTTSAIQNEDVYKIPEIPLESIDKTAFVNNELHKETETTEVAFEHDAPVRKKAEMTKEQILESFETTFDNSTKKMQAAESDFVVADLDVRPKVRQEITEIDHEKIKNDNFWT